MRRKMAAWAKTHKAAAKRQPKSNEGIRHRGITRGGGIRQLRRYGAIGVNGESGE